MTVICHEQVKTTSKAFLNSDNLYTNINHFQSWKILHVMFRFGDTKGTIQTVSHSTLLYEKLPFRTLLSNFQTNVQKFCTFQKTKIIKYLPRCFKKGTFWPLTLDD